MTREFHPRFILAKVMVMLCMILPVSYVAVAQELKLAGGDEENDIWTIPDGTPQELFQYMNRLKQIAPTERTREAAIAHMKKQVETVLAACDKILEGKPESEIEMLVINEKLQAYGALGQIEPAQAGQLINDLMKSLENDTREPIIELVRMYRMQERIANFARMPKESQVAFMDELAEKIQKDGVDRALFGAILQISQSLTQSESTADAVGLFELLAKGMEESNDQMLKARAPTARGMARRFNLPGNFMEITGTTAEGEPFDWDSYRGKVVLVDFWASWCGPCRSEIPNMKEQLEKYGDKGFEIVGVNLDNTVEQYEQYVQTEGLTWTNLMSQKETERGWDNPLAAHYGITGIPTAILVDQEGKVVSMMARGSQLNLLLDELLGDGEGGDGETEDEESEAS